MISPAITEWMGTWKTNGWLTYNGEDVKNKEDFIQLEKLCQQIDVQWVCGCVGVDKKSCGCGLTTSTVMTLH